MDTELLARLMETLDSNRGAVMATVVEAKGSVPREAGAKMLIFHDGTTLGTVGGGSVEKRVVETAREMHEGGETRLLSFDLKKDLAMECGGQVKVYLEALRSNQRLVVFGGGHIGQALYALSPLLGMTPVIVDERPDFCNADRFPRAERHVRLPDGALEALDLGARDHVVIVTHRHQHDLEALRGVVALPVAYVGMIGSKRKVAHTLEQLRAEGVDEADLERVHAPVGLDLGGRTPGEIAVAIAAEIIASRYGKLPHVSKR